MRYLLVLAALAAAEPAEAAMHHATGSFEVTMTPVDDPAIAALAGARWTLTKTYAGPLAGRAHGVMLSAGDPKVGSAGYVVYERIDGTLDGRAGSFSLAHSATMDKGASAMQVAIIPGSGLGALAGITGTMAIRIDAGRHLYDLDYDLTP